ncbi:MAG: hypothetical protein JNM70_12060 [Anaerolineae bacterium]|nr:hypothetical protein [Anaerolineae bacterium]
MVDALERLACTPIPVQDGSFNPQAILPYGCQIAHIAAAMREFVEFLGYINTQLHSKQIARLETLLMPANFSSVVGEFIANAIPKHCAGLVKNQYHNGHPDLIPSGLYPDDAVQHSSEGIEIKASRYPSGWQGHNPEAVWLMVFVFESNRPTDRARQIEPRPFEFKAVFGARLEQSDWTYSGRSESSRRTITASVNRAGYDKLTANWVYRTA